MRSSSRITLFTSTILILLITSCSKENLNPEYHYESVHDLVVNTVASENIPGMIAAIIDSSGILQIESAGVRKTGTPELISDSDLFHLGSCGKAMTGAMMASLVAEYKIGWQSTIIEVFPELEDSILSEYHNITLHQLLTHQGGIANQCEHCVLYEDLDIRERRYLNIISVLKEPNELNAGDYHYSNIGYVIAGTMAERITGQSWETLMQNRIFEPLGMSSAGFGPPGTIDQVDQPWGHNKSNGAWQPNQWDNPEEAGPAGTVHCSVEDWTRFISIYLKQDDTAILERRFLDKLIEPVGNYACGWVVESQDRAGGLVLAHNGSNSMWYASVWIAPNLNRAFIACTNSRDDHTEGIMQAAINNLIKINQEQ